MYEIYQNCSVIVVRHLPLVSDTSLSRHSGHRISYGLAIMAIAVISELVTRECCGLLQWESRFTVLHSVESSFSSLKKNSMFLNGSPKHFQGYHECRKYNMSFFLEL